MRFKKSQKGFTLIELIVVIGILGLAASIVLGALNSARAKSRDARRIADLQQIDNALGLLYSDKGYFPGDSTSYYVVSNNNYEWSQGCAPANTQEALRPYLPNVCTMYGPNGVGASDVYYYVVLTGGTGYRLGARFERSENQGVQFLTGSGGVVSGVYEPK